MKIVKMLLLLSCITQVLGQNFKLTAKLSNVNTDGPYKILLSPEIRSYSDGDLSDIRLYGTDNKEVPYFISKESRSNTIVNFYEIPIIKKEIIPNNVTRIIIENIGSRPLTELVLNIANSNLVKTLNLSGSNDQKEWFGVLDKHQIGELESSASSNVFKKINMPTSVYRFLKIEINDKKTAPINILKIGNYNQTLSNSKLILIKPNTIAYKTIGKKTQVSINFNQPQIIENIAFEIIKPNFYKRNARVLVNGKIEKPNQKTEIYPQSLVEFELNSTTINTFDLPAIFQNEIIIEIDNEDNPALEISDLKFGQIKTYLVAELKTSNKYSLKTGNNTLNSPNYDIAFFKNNIPTILPEASISEVKFIENKPELSQNRNSFWQKPWFLWLCIGIAGAIIFYFSSSLLKDMK